MDYIIRKIKETEYHVFEDFLYEAIFVPEGIEPPPCTILKKPELQIYVEGFGTKKGIWEWLLRWISRVLKAGDRNDDDEEIMETEAGQGRRQHGRK